jgi:predicted dehydrogenase
MPERLTIGLAGCGAVAQRAHLPVLSKLSSVRVAALADSEPARLDAARRLAPRAARFDSADALIERGDVAAVVIALPTAAHADCAIAAFERGLHVYLEKPIAMCLGDGDRIVRAWRRAGSVGAIGFNYRRNPLYARVAALVRDGAIGELVSMRTSFVTPAPASNDWRRTRARGGGALLDLASHHIDLVRFVSGREIARVRATLSSKAFEHDETSLVLALDGGATAHVVASLGGENTDRIELAGTRGALAVDRYRDGVVSVAPVSAVARVAHRVAYGIEKRRSAWHEPSFRLAMTEFVDAALARRATSPDLSDGLAALAVIDAAESSAASGEWAEVAR